MTLPASVPRTLFSNKVESWTSWNGCLLEISVKNKSAEDSVRRDEDDEKDVLLDRSIIMSCCAVWPAVACPVILP